MHYLDTHSGSIQAITSAVLVVVTIAYTVLTRTMATVARETLRPYVYIDISFTSPFEMIMSIGNSGSKVAANVKAVIMKSSNEKLARLVNELPIVSGLGHLAPGGMRRYSLLISYDELCPTDGPSAILELEFSYRDGRHLVKDRQQVNLGGFRESLFPSYGDPLSQIVQKLDQIKNNIPRSSPKSRFSQPCPYCGTLLPGSVRKCHACMEWMPRSSKGRVRRYRSDETSDPRTVRGSRG